MLRIDLLRGNTRVKVKERLIDVKQKKEESDNKMGRLFSSGHWEIPTQFFFQFSCCEALKSGCEEIFDDP